MNVSLKKLAAKIGVKLGLTIVLIYSFVLFFDSTFFNKDLFGILIRFIAIGFGIFSIYIFKKTINTTTFKENFSSYFICLATGYLIVNVFVLITFNFIDKKSGNIIHNNKLSNLNEEIVSLENQLNILNKYLEIFLDESIDQKINLEKIKIVDESIFDIKNMNEDEIKQQIKLIDYFKNYRVEDRNYLESNFSFSIKEVFNGYLQKLLGNAIFGLIISFTIYFYTKFIKISTV
tara:strand:- start:130 stop:828 length:699 start_codon:yes stop_codon:yes gene_type:complete